MTLGDVWKTIVDDVENHGSQWQEWYDIEAPEQRDLPCQYSEKLSKFQQLLVIRCFRPDRVVNAIKNFIIERMHEQYVKSPPIRYEKIYEQSTEKTPIVFILSPGADPLSDVQKLVETVGLG
jgi:dynein heavy chain